MHYHFIAEPMRDTTDKLLGVEINARFTSDTVHPLHPDFIISAWDSEQKRNFMLEQIRLIAEKRDWFEHNSLICTLNLIDEMALLAIGDPAIKSALHALPFIALELSERFLSNTMCLNNLLINSLRDGPNALWLGDLGSGSVGASPLVCGHFDVVKLDRGFFLEQGRKTDVPGADQKYQGILRPCCGEGSRNSTTYRRGQYRRCLGNARWCPLPVSRVYRG